MVSALIYLSRNYDFSSPSLSIILRNLCKDFCGWSVKQPIRI